MNELFKKGIYLFFGLLLLFFLLNLSAGNVFMTSFIRASISAIIVCMVYWIGRSIYFLLFQNGNEAKGNNVNEVIDDDIKASDLIDERKS